MMIISNSTGYQLSVVNDFGEASGLTGMSAEANFISGRMYYYINLTTLLLRYVLVVNCLLANGRICSWRAANYNNVGKGFALKGHIIASLQVPDIFECLFACFKDSRCRSYNFRVSDPPHLCELNSESVYMTPENYTLHEDMIYYDAGRSAGCSSSPCQNGGRCVSSCRLDIPFSFVCDCDDLHTGDMCQNWTEKSKDYDLKFLAKSLSNNVSMAISNKPIKALTFCIWFQTTQTGSFGLVGGDVNLTCDEYTRCNFSLKGAKRDFYSAPLNDGDWHSICITWQQSTRICAAYIDGKTNKRRTFTGCRENCKFEFSTKPLVLGQSVNSKGEFQESNSFTGSIHGINMWDHAMEENKVFNLATNCSSRVGNVVSWPLFRNVLDGNVILREGSLCKGPDLSSKVSLRFPALTVVDRIRYSQSLPSLQAFTLCQWTRLVFMHSESTYFSYANSESPNALFLMLRKDLTIRMFINNVRLQIYRAPFLDRHWHHACVTWTNNGGELKVHIDGSLIRVETSYRNGDVIHGGGILIFGQDQDKLGGSFVASQSFVGFLSHLNLWNFVMHSLVLVDMATGFGTENGNTVTWKDVIQSQAYGQVEVVPTSQDPPTRSITDFKYVFASQTNESHVQLYDAATDETIVRFTACVWVSVSQSETMSIFSYRTSEMRNAIGMRLRLGDSESFTVIVNNEFLHVDYDNFFGKTGWQHICVTWENGAGTWRLYVNGESVKSGSGLQSGVEIKGKGELLLGQSYRVNEDVVKEEQTFVGEISHLNIWNRKLHKTIIQAMYQGCDSTGGNFFDWSSLLSGQVVGQVTRETSAECTFPDEIIRSKRNLFCERMTKDGCSTPLYALFDGTENSRAKKWRCYFSDALRQDSFGLLAYDYTKKSTCYITISDPDFYHGE